MNRKVIFTIIMCMFYLNVFAQNELSDDERVTIEQRVLEKIDDFISYLPEIAAKNNKSEDEKQLAQKYISKALDLFIGEGKEYE